jgi:hypothetical protein
VAAGWENIEGETNGTYVVTSEDLGRRVRVSVVASNPDGSASAASAPTAPIGATGVNRAASSSSCGKKARAKSSRKARAKASRKARKAAKARAASCKKAKASAAKRKKAKRR